MNCLRCGTWNPDDKRLCWRCQAELPKPAAKRERRPLVFLGLPAWTWGALTLLLAGLFAAQCLAPLLLGGE